MAAAADVVTGAVDTAATAVDTAATAVDTAATAVVDTAAGAVGTAATAVDTAATAAVDTAATVVDTVATAVVDAAATTTGDVVMIDGGLAAEGAMTGGVASVDTNLAGDTVIITTDPGATAVVSGMDLQPVVVGFVTDPEASVVTADNASLPGETIVVGVDPVPSVVDTQAGAVVSDSNVVASEGLVVDVPVVSGETPVNTNTDAVSTDPVVAIDPTVVAVGQPGAGLLVVDSLPVVPEPVVVAVTETAPVIDQPGSAVIDPMAALEMLDALFVNEPVGPVVAADVSARTTGADAGSVPVAQPTETVVTADTVPVVDPVVTVIDTITPVAAADAGTVIVQPTDPVAANANVDPSVVTITGDASAATFETAPAVGTGIASNGSATIVDASVVDPTTVSVDVLPADPATAVVTSVPVPLDIGVMVDVPVLVSIDPVPADPIVDANIVPVDTVVPVDGPITMTDSVVIHDAGVVDSSAPATGSVVNVEPVVNSGIETVAVVGEPTSPVEALVTVEAGPRLVFDSVAPDTVAASEPVVIASAVEPVPIVDTVLVDAAPIVEVPVVDATATVTGGETSRVLTVERTVTTSDGAFPSLSSASGGPNVDTSRVVLVEQPITPVVDTSATGFLDNTIIRTTGDVAATSGIDASTIIRPNTGTRTSSTPSRTSILAGSAVGSRGVVDNSALMTAPFTSDVSLDFGREWLKARVDSGIYSIEKIHVYFITGCHFLFLLTLTPERLYLQKLH